jgi:multiple sugar transport system substrate-binding protein
VIAAEEDCSFSGWSGSVGVAVLAGTAAEQNLEQAYRFIEYIAGPEGQTAQAELGFAIPNQRDLADSDVFLQPDQLPANAQVFLEAARCEFPNPSTRTPNWAQWFDPFFWQGSWQSAVVEGSQSVADAFAERKDQAQADLDFAWQTFEESLPN